LGSRIFQVAGKATALCADVWALRGKNGRPSKIKRGGHTKWEAVSGS
jgi:hypothetical protein